MADGQSEQAQARFSPASSPETHFSWLRTRMSIERTLMSSVRTATALIAFGFTLFQFLNQVNRMPGAEPARHPEAARYLGLVLIAAGIIGLVISIWEYRSMVRYLWRPEFRSVAGVDKMPWRPPTQTISFILVLAGIFAFCAVLLRL